MENNKGQKRRKRDANALMKSNIATLSINKLKRIVSPYKLKRILDAYATMPKEFGCYYKPTTKDRAVAKEIVNGKHSLGDLKKIFGIKETTKLYNKLGKIMIAIHGRQQ